MAIKNKSKYAILGVLCMKPCSGYDIKKFCDKTISHFWNENFGHIYPVLKQLLEEGFILPVDRESSDDRRKIYQITEEGKQEFLNWLVQAPELQPPRSELLLKLSFGNYMPKVKVFEFLDEVKERNTRNLKQYKIMETAYLSSTEAKKDPAFPYWLASLRLGIVNAEVMLKWCEDTQQLLKSFSPENY